MVAMKIRAMKINHARKRYFEMPYLNILMRGQLKSMTPRAKRNIQMSLLIEQYYNKTNLYKTGCAYNETSMALSLSSNSRVLLSSSPWSFSNSGNRESILDVAS